MSATNPLYPGIPTTADGSTAVVWVEKHISQGACAYPITPSTPMGVGYEAEVARGTRNLWDEPLSFLEPESEHSSASACEGFAVAGGRVTNFTSGQGLILMKEVLYTISGKRLPVVFHVGARALTSQALNVHAGHDDVMGVADTGWGMLFARHAQDAADLALIARRAAEASSTAFFSVQDGFLTTHTVENVRLPEPELMREFVGSPDAKLLTLFDPATAMQSGVVQNQDSYMKGKVAQRAFTDTVMPALQAAMDEFESLTGRRHRMVESYRMEDAEFALVGMGSLVETACATADWLRRHRGMKIGVVHITAFRPFPTAQVVSALANVSALAVIERLDIPLAQSNPLAAEVKAAFADALTGFPGLPRMHRMPVLYSGCAGLGSRDVRPGDLIAAADHMQRAASSRVFVLGIRHPLALEAGQDPDVSPGAFAMRGHSIGGFGSVTTNKVMATLLGDMEGLYVQAYPLYGSEKKGLPTTYYLVVSEKPVRTHCELAEVDFVPLNDINAFNLGNPLQGLRPGGMLFLQTAESDPARIWSQLPTYAQIIIRERGLRVLALDTQAIARTVATTSELQTRMQGIVLLGVFLRHSPVVARRGLQETDLFAAVEKSLRRFFGKRGDAVVQANLEAVRRGYHEVLEVPAPALTKPAEAVPGPRVSDIMHAGVIACSPHTPVRDAARRMHESHISALVVTDEGGHAVGVISTTDLANLEFVSPHVDLQQLTVERVMSQPVLYTGPETPLSEASAQLRDARVHRLVVCEAGNGHLKPVGILSVTDLVRDLAELEPAAR